MKPLSLPLPTPDEPLSDLTFHEEWVHYLHANIPLYSKLPESLQLGLHQKITLFLSTTTFEGSLGLDLSNEMILSVAAQACVLVLSHDEPPYSELKKVILYPSSFTSIIETMDDDDGIFNEHIVECDGESWEDGTVRLAWDAVCHGARNISDGDNVTFHEFAHQLDARDGDTDGVPLLSSPEAYKTWATVLGEHCSDFIECVINGEETVLDPYAATNPGEYFAVATESFFEQPQALKTRRPTLYATLQDFYQLDPASW
jgi:Mlc titration factor MtfA (ptsG expression regulator)